MSPPLPPFPRSYWADSGQLLAGVYPGDAKPEVAQVKLASLLDVGVRTIVNLMEPDETNWQGQAFVPYMRVIEGLAAKAGIAFHFENRPVPDQGIPSVEGMHAIQAALQAGIDRGGAVYVHCWGGKGRTGTAVGIYRIQRGLSTPEDFVAHIDQLRNANGPPGLSPENDTQIGFVKSYCAATTGGPVG